MNRPWPPNPRDAKHRTPVKMWSTLPVTMFMIAVCLVSALRTQIGSRSENEDWMFFQSQSQRQELEKNYNSVVDQLRQLDENETGVNTSTYQDLEKQLIEIDDAIRNNDALSDVKSGQVWRLFTPMFLHFGIMHIVFNMYWLWMLGGLLELRYRPGRYLLLVLAVALVSNLAQALAGGTNFGGMSGVNYGLFGFILLHQKYHPSPSFRLDQQTVFIMLAWLVLCFTGMLGHVANWAHAFGFLTGATAGFANAMLAGGIKHIKRRSDFKRAVSSVRDDTLHQCAVCGKTERDDAYLEFRVGADGLEYCADHLPQDES